MTWIRSRGTHQLHQVEIQAEDGEVYALRPCGEVLAKPKDTARRGAKGLLVFLWSASQVDPGETLFKHGKMFEIHMFILTIDIYRLEFTDEYPDLFHMQLSKDPHDA